MQRVQAKVHPYVNNLISRLYDFSRLWCQNINSILCERFLSLHTFLGEEDTNMHNKLNKIFDCNKMTLSKVYRFTIIKMLSK